MFFQTKNRIPQFLTIALCTALCLSCTVQAPVFSSTYYETGIQHYSKSQFREAIFFFQRTLETDHNHVNSRYYLADTYMKLNQPVLAEQHYQRVLEIAPNSQAARLSKMALISIRKMSDAQKRHQRLKNITINRGNLGREDRYQGLAEEGDDYLDKVTQGGKLVRWSFLTMPLTVYIEEKPIGIQNFQPAFYSSVRQALDTWVAALNQQLTYQLTTIPEKADIRITWTNSIDSHGSHNEGGTSYTAGLMIPRFDNNQIDYMTVKIATFDISGKPQSNQAIHAVAIHEIGHSLGLLGHSDNPDDIMYAQNKQVLKLSTRDINTIRLLYSSQPDINNLNPEQRAIDPEKEKEQAKKLDEELVQAEETIQRFGTALNWLNLGVLYFQKAEGLSEQQQKNTWYNKALVALQKAEAIEPNDVNVKQRISLVYQALDNFELAEEAIRKAIAINPKEPEYYMLHAWYLVKLNRKAEARGELDRYLRERPNRAGSSGVKKIEDALAKE